MHAFRVSKEGEKETHPFYFIPNDRSSTIWILEFSVETHNFRHSNSQIDFSSHSILIDGRNDSASLQHTISKDSSIEKRLDSNSTSNFRRPSEVSAEEYAIQQLDRNIEKMMRNGHYTNYKRTMEEREGGSASSATLNNNNKSIKIP